MSADPIHVPTAAELRDSLRELVRQQKARIAELEAALKKVSAIRDSIIGLQTVNWSEHVYPLVQVLNESGFKGMDYPEAQAKFGTMLERTNAAQSEVSRLSVRVTELEAALASTLTWLPVKHADQLRKVLRLTTE